MPDLAPPDARPPTTDPLPGRQIVVLGLMGAGKTTVASRLAARFGRPLRDSDADLRRQQGRTAAQLAAELGAAGLHELEAAHLLAAVAGDDAVIAAAASTVDRADCRAALARAAVVWLDGDPGVLAARHSTGSHRPAYDTDLIRMLRGMDERRRPLFAAVADVVVPVPQPRKGMTRAEREKEKDGVAAAAAQGLASLAAELGAG